MEEKNLNTIILLIIVGITIGLILGLWFFRPTPPIGVAELNRFSNAENSTVIISGAATSLLSARGGRMYVRFDNASTTGSIWCAFGGIADAAIDKGMIVEPGEYYEIKPGNLYVGQVSCITAGGDAKVGVIEK